MIKDFKSKTKKELLEKIQRLKYQLSKLNEKFRKCQMLNKAVFEHSPVGITVRFGSGELVSFNKAWKKIWSLSYQKIRENERKCKGWGVAKRYSYLKSYIPKVQKIFDSGGEIFIPEIHIVDPKTNFDRWISQHYYAIKNQEGRIEYVVTITQDITQQKRTLLALQESEEELRTIMNNVNLGIYRSTATHPGHFIRVNPAFLKIFGYNSMKQVLKVPVEKFYKNPKERQRFLKELIKRGEVRDMELELKKNNGSTFWASIYARVHYDENHKPKWIDGVIEDITEKKRMTETLRALSFTDELTGLYNRRAFLTIAGHQLRIAEEAKKTILLFFIDMDNLKDINDEFGHPLGDQALIYTSRILRKTFRESDIIARIGGDEFVVMTLGMQKAKGEVFYARLQKSLEKFNKSKKLNFDISLSAGWSYFDPRKPCGITNLLKKADRMMYRHKVRKKVK